MRLHAVLGGSLCSVASVVLSNNWEEVNIYCDDDERFRKFVEGLGNTTRAGSVTVDFPQPVLHRIEVPLDERTGSDMKARGLSVSKMLNGLPRVSEDDVLYYSGTPVDLVPMISMLGFRRWIIPSRGGLEICGLGGDEALEMKVWRWSEASILKFHGLRLVDGEIEHEKLVPLKLTAGERKSGGYELDLNSNGTQIKIVWKGKFTTSVKRRKTASRVMIMNELLGGDIIHEMPDRSLQLWCRNTLRPFPVHEPEVGPEPEVSPELDQKSVTEMTVDEISEWFVSKIKEQDEPVWMAGLGQLWSIDKGCTINSVLKPHKMTLGSMIREIVETKEDLILLGGTGGKVGVLREGEEE